MILIAATFSNANADLRNIQVNDLMRSFTLKNLEGKDFSYQQGQKQVWLFTFISADQPQTQKALNSIAAVIKQVREKEKTLKLIVISTKKVPNDFYRSLQKAIEQDFSILLDTNYQLWGKLGIIVTPSFLIVDQKDTITWIKSGYSYDFEPNLKTALWQAMGLIEKQQTQKKTEVKSLENNTHLAKMRRHLKMAKLLEKKNRIEAAIAEIRKAQALVPDSSEAQIELGQLLCRNAQSKEALEIANKIDPNDHVERAAKHFITGWAYHLLGDLDQAEEHLIEATVLNPKSARVLYELGKVYRANGKTQKALDAFQLALAEMFGEPKPSTTVQD